VRHVGHQPSAANKTVQLKANFLAGVAFNLQVMQHWQQGLLARAFTCWRDAVLLKQQYGIIVRMVGSSVSKRLVWQAWTAWRVSELGRSCIDA
jgi:hypothetical protein